MRLLHWEQGIIDEPESSTFDLELGDWRRYEAYAPSNPAMAQQTVTNLDAFEDRVETWRERFFETAALPEAVRARLIGELAVNMVDRPPSEIVTRVEPAIDDAWKQDAVRSPRSPRQRAAARGNRGR